MRLSGWSTDCVLCLTGLTCPTDRVVELEVSSRAYANGERANAAWSTVDAVQFTWTAESCGSPCDPNCWQSDRVKIGEADATPDAGDWNDGELVFIRILRDESVTNDLPATFHLSRVRLEYPVD